MVRPFLEKLFKIQVTIFSVLQRHEAKYKT